MKPFSFNSFILSPSPSFISSTVEHPGISASLSTSVKWFPLRSPRLTPCEDMKNCPHLMKSVRFAKFRACETLIPLIDMTCVVIALLSFVPANPILFFSTPSFFEMRERTSVPFAFSLQQTKVTNG